MGAIIKACLVGNSIKNTGKECDASMGATAMLIAVPKGFTFTDTDLADPLTWLNTKVHALKASRVYPLFGINAPIRTITNNKEADVLVTLDDGSQVFLRYGFFNRMFETTSGGICYAEALQGLNKSGYSIIEIDQQGQMLVHDNEDGTYQGLVTDFMYSPSPILADFKSTPYKNQFMISYNPIEYVQNGLILSGALPLLAEMGLIDSEVTKAAATTNSGATAATGTDTITNVGADNDKINIGVSGVSISGDVVKTSAESTVTLLAAKIVVAINALTTTTGYSAANTAGAITVTAPAGLGASINTILMVNTITGTIAATVVAFSGGVTGTAKLKIGVFTDCAEADLVAQFGALMATAGNFVVTNKATGAIITQSASSLVSGHVELSIPYLSATYTVKGAVPSVWLAAGIAGYDAEDFGVNIVVV